MAKWPSSRPQSRFTFNHIASILLLLFGFVATANGFSSDGSPRVIVLGCALLVMASVFWIGADVCHLLSRLPPRQDADEE